MRIQTNLDDAHRAAVKAYADANGYTMPKAYTKLLKDALWSASLLRYNERNDTFGVKHRGHNSSIMTNTSLDILHENSGEWHQMYMPYSYALERAGIDVPDEPTIFDSREELPPEEEPSSRLETIPLEKTDENSTDA